MSTSELVVQEPLEQVVVPVNEKDIVVIARNPEQMKLSQEALITWATGKLAEYQADYEDLEANLKIAAQRKWRTEPFKRRSAIAKKKVEFYEKIKAALEAGYCIVPDIPGMDVFAIRTTRKHAKPNTTKWTVRDQETNSPPIGDGRHVNSEAVTTSFQALVRHDVNSQPVYEDRFRAIDFKQVEFPMTLVKPQIMDETGKAMALKIFDDFGFAPGRHRRDGDPMVVGRVRFRTGSQERNVSFLIAWFIDTRAL